MIFYTIFDDFDPQSALMIRDAGIELVIHPKGVPRPEKQRMTEILREYDGVIIGTSQKLSEDMFEAIDTPRIIGTASVGTDHIRIPEDKKQLIWVLNAPTASAYPVSEYVFAAVLSCCRRIGEGAGLYAEGRDNKSLSRKPEELSGKTIGVVGAGNIAEKIMEFAGFFGMRILCWTRRPEQHAHLAEKGTVFVSLERLAQESDVIALALPSNAGTKGLISAGLASKMKDNAVFVSISRRETMDVEALIEKSRRNRNFYSCLDLDLDEEIRAAAKGLPNVVITPHIAGGTRENRIRMFREVTVRMLSMCQTMDA